MALASSSCCCWCRRIAGNSDIWCSVSRSVSERFAYRGQARRDRTVQQLHGVEDATRVATQQLEHLVLRQVLQCPRLIHTAKLLARNGARRNAVKELCRLSWSQRL